MPNVWDPRGRVDPFVGEDATLKLFEGGGETNLGGGGDRAYPPKAVGEVAVELSRLTFMTPESPSKPWRN